MLDISRYFFVNAMTTVSAVVFLYSPDTMLASVAIVNLDEAGDIGPAAAMAASIVVTSMPCACCLLLTRVLLRGRKPGATAGTQSLGDLFSSWRHHEPNDPILLTPGPLTTSLETKRRCCATGARGTPTSTRSRRRSARTCCDMVHGEGTHVCVPLQGSGTFSVEAAHRQPRAARRQGAGAEQRRLLPAHREDPASTSAARIRRSTSPRTSRSSAADDRRRAGKMDPAITHVAQVHCETGTGILNPLPEIAAACARHGKGLIVDAMSSFGAIDIDVSQVRRSTRWWRASGKCIEGPPGMGFVIARQAVLEKCAGQLALARDGPARPVDVHAEDHAVALHAAHARGRRLPRGARPVQGRGRHSRRAARATGRTARRWSKAWGRWDSGAFLPRAVQAPVIVTFHAPGDPNYAFKAFYEKVKARGYILYPGKLTQVETFRVGCMGQSVRRHGRCRRSHRRGPEGPGHRFPRANSGFGLSCSQGEP